jgi:hypothetical protein
MKPFNSYFVQIAKGTDIIFDRNYQTTTYFAPRRNRGISEVRTGVTLTQDDRTEHIGLLYGNYTDEYEINADLVKMFGFAPVLSGYSLAQGEALAFQAVSIDSLYPIPVGYRNANSTTMTFAFDTERYTNNGLGALWLYDSQLNKYTNLLRENYTFVPSANKEENRFYITIELDVPTDTENVFEINKETIFDILGRRMTEVYSNGIYIIFKNGKYTKVIQ